MFEENANTRSIFFQIPKMHPLTLEQMFGKGTFADADALVQNAQKSGGVFVQNGEEKKIKKTFQKGVDIYNRFGTMVLYSNGYRVGE